MSKNIEIAYRHITASGTERNVRVGLLLVMDIPKLALEIGYKLDDYTRGIILEWTSTAIQNHFKKLGRATFRDGILHLKVPIAIWEQFTVAKNIHDVLNKIDDHIEAIR